MCCAMAGVVKTHIPKRANQEKNCTQLSCLMVVGIFLKSSKMSIKLDSLVSPSSAIAFKCACSSSNRANSSGEYSLVENSVTNMEATKTTAPIINETTKWCGTLPSAAVLSTSNQLAKT
eukprot:GDKK01068307.1.p2 GENE.GDKK01068307.1~~GDKK01068307.1.p2  ORF type:complete len:119 (-),score=8.20 GDKK01068307.1:195-551(-)